MPEVAPRPVHNPVSEPAEQPHRPTTGSGGTGSDASAEKKPDSTANEKQSGFNPIELLKDGTTGITNAASAVGEWSLTKLGIASKEMLMPAYDAATQSKVDKAVKGNEISANHEKQFMQMKGPYSQEPLEKNPEAPRVRDNPNGSHVKLNAEGRIQEFTTAPTKDNPSGLTYKNIQYDQKGLVKSFETPWGTTHSRVGDADANGYGNWQAKNKQGQLVNYSGSDSAQWQGKSVVDETGFHNIVASGPKAWNMYSRLSDGTHVETHPQVDKGVLKGFDTTTTLADSTKLSTKSHFEKGEIVRNPNVDINEPNGEKSSVELNDSKKSGKFVTPEERKRIEAFSAMLDFDKNPMFSHLNSLKVTRSGNNLNFAADLDKPLDTPPPNVRVTGLGPFGGASAVPISSRINDPSGTIVTHPENPGQVDITNMHGFTGESQAYGPRGRPRGVHSGTTNSMTLYSDQNGQGHLIARSDKANVNLTANNMRGGMFGDVLADPAKKKEFTDGVAKLRDSLDSFEFKRDRDGNLQGSFDPRADHIPLNKKLDADPFSKGIGLEATNLYFKEGKLNFNIEKTADGKSFNFKQGDLQVGVKSNLSSGETKMSVSKIVTTRDQDGRAHTEVEFYGKPGRTRLF